jgi:dTDP-glucose 4,6-dehydratase
MASTEDRLGPGSHLLVTGGAGFIGSSFVREVLARGDGTRITVLDTLTYAGNEANLQPVLEQPGQAARLRFVRGDIADPATVGPLVADVDAILNFAAESHVDRSILDPEAFLRTGVIGVHVLLDACRAEAAALAAGERRTASGDPRPAPRYLQVSTDEVYGSVETGRSVESDVLAPRSPYSAAKAAGELLVRSYVVTHGIDAVVTRGSNTYGPYHHPEKLIPLFITNALEDRPLPLYGDGLQQRDWLYVTDHAGAIETVMRRGTSGETYNIPGSAEMTNRDVVRLLLEALGKPWSLVRTVEDRPGHDRRYALDGSKLAALGWHNKVEFGDGLRRTVDWFRANEGWWRAIKGGDWDAYYERQYGRRLAGSEPAASEPAASGPGRPAG